jgi:hypothetical protein
MKLIMSAAEYERYQKVTTPEGPEGQLLCVLLDLASAYKTELVIEKEQTAEESKAKELPDLTSMTPEARIDFLARMYEKGLLRCVPPAAGR